MKVYIVIRLSGKELPKILNVYTDKDKAEKAAYKYTNAWCNVIEREVIK